MGLGIHKNLDLQVQDKVDLRVQDMVQQGMQGEESRCNLGPQEVQLGKAP